MCLYYEKHNSINTTQFLEWLHNFYRHDFHTPKVNKEIATLLRNSRHLSQDSKFQRLVTFGLMQSA